MTRPSICRKTHGRAFQKLDQAFEALKENRKLDQEFEKLAACFCYNTAHALPMSHGNFSLLNLETRLHYFD